jgi:hypothetical protein
MCGEHTIWAKPLRDLELTTLTPQSPSPYNAAMRDDRLPRKPLPRPSGTTRRATLMVVPITRR